VQRQRRLQVRHHRNTRLHDRLERGPDAPVPTRLRGVQEDVPGRQNEKAFAFTPRHAAQRRTVPASCNRRMPGRAPRQAGRASGKDSSKQVGQRGIAHALRHRSAADPSELVSCCRAAGGALRPRSTQTCRGSSRCRPASRPRGLRRSGAAAHSVEGAQRISGRPACSTRNRWVRARPTRPRPVVRCFATARQR
jgi:hypothetical protein